MDYAVIKVLERYLTIPVVKLRGPTCSHPEHRS